MHYISLLLTTVQYVRKALYMKLLAFLVKTPGLQVKVRDSGKIRDSGQKSGTPVKFPGAPEYVLEALINITNHKKVKF